VTRTCQQIDLSEHRVIREMIRYNAHSSANGFAEAQTR